MPLKPRDQWKPNFKLQTAREEAFGKKSRTRFARAAKRRCQELYGGHCGVDHRTVRRWEGACEPDVCHQQAIAGATTETHRPLAILGGQPGVT